LFSHFIVGISVQVWFADAHIGSVKFGVLFAAELAADYKMMASELGDDGVEMIAVEANASTAVLLEDLTLAKCGKFDFQIYDVSPRLSSGWAFVGEQRTKWVGVSPDRFEAIEDQEAGVRVSMTGVSGEVVEVGFVKPASLDVVYVKCEIGESGRAEVVAPALECNSS